MKKEVEYEYKMTNYAIKGIAYVLRWLFLIAAIVNVAFVVAIIVISIFKLETVDNINMISQLMAFMTHYDIIEINELLRDLGLIKVVTGGIAIGLTHVINFIVLYVLASNFITVFSSFDKETMFTKENVNIVNSSVPFAFILTFTQPVIVFVTSFATGLYDSSDINVSGLGVLIIAYVLKILFNKGYEVSLKKDKVTKELSEQKAEFEEAKMKALKTESIKATKKTTRTKKVASKEETPKKSTTKKVTKKDAVAESKKATRVKKTKEEDVPKKTTRKTSKKTTK